MEPPPTDRPHGPDGPPGPLVVVMGVAGSGKSTLGRALAKALEAPFCDADDLHPPANKERMQQGLPLDDAHRWPWLELVHARLRAAAVRPRGLVLACSALKQVYRDRLAEGLPGLVFVHLHADRDTLARRLQRRHGHFFPASLLDSQLDTLEPPDAAIACDATRPLAELTAELVLRLRGPGPAD